MCRFEKIRLTSMYCIGGAQTQYSNGIFSVYRLICVLMQRLLANIGPHIGSFLTVPYILAIASNLVFTLLSYAKCLCHMAFRI